MPDDRPKINTTIVEPETAITPPPTLGELSTMPASSPMSPLEQAAQNIAQLAPKEDKLLTVSSKSLGEVLPLSFYEGASQLTLTAEEKETLMRLQDTPDDDVEIRPDGLVYAEHIHARRALTELFGAEWALLPGSAIAQEKDSDKITIFQRWVLTVRGRYVGEAIGAGTFWANNSKTNKSDAAEGAQSEALRRICAKSALGIGSNVWDRRFAREWRRNNARQYWVKTNKGNEKLWRRIDDDPFDGEIGMVKEPEKREVKDEPRTNEQGPGSNPEGGENSKRKSGAEVLGSAGGERHNDANTSGQASQPVVQCSPPPQAKGFPPKVTPQPMTTEPATPVAAANPSGEPNPLGEGELANFKRMARVKKLWDSVDPLPLVGFICQTLNIPAIAPSPGEKPMDTIRRLFLSRTRQEFNEILMPKLREKS